LNKSGKQKKLSCASYLKLNGWVSLKKFCEFTGQADSTMQDWFKNYRQQFEDYAEGVRARREREILERLKEKRNK